MFFPSKLIISLSILALLDIIANFGTFAVDEIFVENSPYETWLEDEVVFFRDDGKGNSSTQAVCFLIKKFFLNL